MLSKIFIDSISVFLFPWWYISNVWTQFCEDRWKHFRDAAWRYFIINTSVVSYFYRYIPEFQQNSIWVIEAKNEWNFQSVMKGGIQKFDSFYFTIIYLQCKNIFACLFSVHNTISLSRHEQVCLIRLRFERYFSHHRAT